MSPADSSATGESYGADLSFQSWRRQIIDEVLFGVDLMPLEQVVAIAIAYSSNKTSYLTYESFGSFAKRLHLKLGVVEKVAHSLQAKGRLKIEHYRGKPHLQLIANGRAQYRSTRGDKRFYARRGSFVEAILGFNLPPYVRMAYIGIAALTDPATGSCEEGGAWIGSKIGVSKFRMTTAIKKLVASGLAQSVEHNGSTSTLSVCDPTKPPTLATNPAPHPAPHPAPAQVLTLDRSKGCGATTGTPGTIQYLRTASIAARQTVPDIDLDVLDEVITILGNYGDADDTKTIAGIVAISESDKTACNPISYSQIQSLVRDGLLIRDGQHISISEAGYEAVNRREAA
jgi:hypothetical protein